MQHTGASRGGDLEIQEKGCRTAELKVQFMSRVWRNLSRTSSQHHNFVSRLMEEKMELRNTLGHLEEEIWRYRQRGAEQQVCLSLDKGREVPNSRMAMIRVKTTQIRRTDIWKLVPHRPKRGCRYSWPLIK
ncbi:uncharacterized protein [Magallana gigas]|uniref:uncharacterized protein isoform X3 n=1 Tax=Magallana gigas TaxID=29159 RepID=UPI00333EED44